VAGGEAVKVSPVPAMFALESTDGASVLYVEGATTNRPGPLWRLPLGGGEPVKLADNVLANSFDVIDAGVYYLEAAPGDIRLQFYSFSTRRSTIVASKLGNLSPVITASRDGRTIYFSRADSAIEDLMLVENFR
jgi:hypothetical protein